MVKCLTKMTWLLSILLASSLVLAAFLGYGDYVLRSENLRLKAEIQGLIESQNALEDEYAELQAMHDELLNEYTALNQFYQELNANYTCLNQTCQFLLQNYTALSSEYQKVLLDYVDLTVAYASLNQTYSALLENYTLLEQEVANYTVLLGEYQELLQDYQVLLANYTQLKNAYDGFYFALYEPLLSSDKVTPSISELEQWLAEDKTDDLNYTLPDFVCGDYAVMLHMHAKMKHWDMGVVAVLGSFNGSEFNHAFNAINCQEGLVYVEPQNDQVFSIEGNPYNHPGFGQVYVDEFIVVILYDNE